ncbi:MAG TPA: DUF5325 family protein [Virgibacillus sp.]|nr:DUF5325 family protein [Virgibacillus sp.]
MNKINVPMLLLAILIISMFAAVGVAISFRNALLVILFLFLGFVLMGYGISLKRKSDS